VPAFNREHQAYCTLAGLFLGGIERKLPGPGRNPTNSSAKAVRGRRSKDHITTHVMGGIRFSPRANQVLLRTTPGRGGRSQAVGCGNVSHKNVTVSPSHSELLSGSYKWYDCLHFVVSLCTNEIQACNTSSDQIETSNGISYDVLGSSWKSECAIHKTSAIGDFLLRFA
jgi:hypothetical protein